MSDTNIKGLTYLDSRKACMGFTLFAPINDKKIYLVDMLGKITNSWDIDHVPAGAVELLPDSNLIYLGKKENDLIPNINGSAGIIREIDWEGRTVFEHEDPYLHHSFYRMDNGNTLVLKWTKSPDDIVEKMGRSKENNEKNAFFTDVIQEIDKNGEIVWQWFAYENPDLYNDPGCSLCEKTVFPCMNSIIELSDGNIMVSLFKTSTLIIIDKSTKEIVWKWKSEEVSHPHSIQQLDNGNILLFDSALHLPGTLGEGYSRALEIDKEGNMVWEYGEYLAGTRSFYSATRSNCQRLPNGNTLICEGKKGRIFELDDKDDVVWEYMSGHPSFEHNIKNNKYDPVYAAYRYELDYSGFKRPGSGPSIPPEAKQEAPGKTIAGNNGESDAVASRLELLGY